MRLRTGGRPLPELSAIAAEAIDKHGALQKQTELVGLLAVVAATRPRTIWEIGLGSGGTLWALVQSCAPEEVVSIDLPGGPYGVDPVSPEELHELIGDVLVIQGDSQKVRIPSCHPDFLLIDGDHTEDGVRGDWE